MKKDSSSTDTLLTAIATVMVALPFLLVDLWAALALIQFGHPAGFVVLLFTGISMIRWGWYAKSVADKEQS